MRGLVRTVLFVSPESSLSVSAAGAFTVALTLHLQVQCCSVIAEL